MSDARNELVNGFKFYYCVDAPYRDCDELHQHSFYEVFYFLSGKINYLVGSQTFHLLPGDILLISPEDQHCAVLQPQKGHYTRIVLWIDKEFLKNIPTVFPGNLLQCFKIASRTRSNLFRPLPGQRQRIVEILNRLLVEEKMKHLYGSNLLSIANVISLLVELNRAYADPEQLTVKNSASRTEELVNDVLIYLDERFADPITLDDLAARFFISKSYLSHIFKKYTGISVYRYITKKRLSVAKDLLDHGAMPLEVSTDCGFNDYSTFYRAYKAEYGLLPKKAKE